MVRIPLFLFRRGWDGVADANLNGLSVFVWVGLVGDTCAVLPSDVMLGLEVLRTQFPAFGKSKMGVPVLLKNQLYAIVSDRTQVDREVVRVCISEPVLQSSPANENADQA